MLFSGLPPLFASLSDPIRLRIVRLLLERELCVCEIMRTLQQPQYKISRHLGILKKGGLLRGWREGAWVHYEINPALPVPARKVLDGMRAWWDAYPEVRKDLTLLRRAARRPAGEPPPCAPSSGRTQ